MKRWLDDLGLGKYAGAFAASDIDRDVLPKLTTSTAMSCPS